MAIIEKAPQIKQEDLLTTLLQPHNPQMEELVERINDHSTTGTPLNTSGAPRDTPPLNFGRS